MTMIKIICPKCNAEAKLSLVDANFTGPRRCWKCHEAFTMTIKNSQVTSCTPLSKEEFEKWQEEKKAADKAQESGLNFSRRDQPETRQENTSPQQKEEFFRPNIPHTPNTTGKPPAEGTGEVFPPIRVNTFIPVEDIKTPPEKKPQQKPKNPPERFNTFIPPQT